ncbi:hypothetical protein MOX02_59570 [Methylobacterium oxalidis]|uniref:Uncharacterized protein n=1 Tax=Methylobacterium oxalidis TaxID=944322 RepID=A0A512JD85_9HYPH|nr:hypothetical protein MOX02_59570 [Methylobacterium oxalidis]
MGVETGIAYLDGFSSRLLIIIAGKLIERARFFDLSRPYSAGDKHQGLAEAL